jgi:hypothetical protein
MGMPANLYPPDVTSETDHFLPGTRRPPAELAAACLLHYALSRGDESVVMNPTHRVRIEFCVP